MIFNSLRMLLVLLALVVVCMYCQTPAPKFDLASVKVSNRVKSFNQPSFSEVKLASPGRLVAVNASLSECLRWAYDLKEFQVSGPGWIESGPNYEIEAKTESPAPVELIRLMLQALLADRFKLQIHRESKIHSVYFLMVGKDGPKLKKSATDGKPSISSSGSSNGVAVKAETARMEDLAHRLSLDMDRPVFDRTGLTERYQFTLSWAREGEGPSIFSAVKEQLGLELKAGKAPIEILVVDKAEQIPAAN